jgi:hypothetical protein
VVQSESCNGGFTKAQLADGLRLRVEKKQQDKTVKKDAANELDKRVNQKQRELKAKAKEYFASQ